MPTCRQFSQVIPTIESVLAVLPRDACLWIVCNGDIKHFHLMNENTKTLTKRCEIRVLYVDTPGLLSGRHAPVDQISHDIISYIDDDILVADTWVDAILAAFSDPETHLVGGPSRPDFEIRKVEWLSKFFVEHDNGRSCGYLSLLDLGTESRVVSPDLIWGLNFSIRKASLIELGGFHPDGVPWELRRFRGDGESGLALKIISRKWLARYETAASVIHLVPQERLTIDYFLKRAFLQGISDSYTKIRSEGRSPTVNSPDSSLRVSASGIFKRGLVSLLDFTGIWKKQAPSDLTAVSDARAAGNLFHQREVSSDNSLLGWVCRDNYFDFRYPVT